MAASTSQTNQTSHPTKWDVFLSFRGVDTRDSFTDFLYHSLDRTGIRTFRDDPELRSGEVISDALLRAIHESKIHVVVLSENYAFSRWCLDELVEILDCHASMKTLVIPVFYYIEPAAVKFQTGSFGKAFEKHKNRFDPDRLDKWRLTLKEVGEFSGYHVRESISQANVINEIVDRVLDEVKPGTLDVGKYQVGLDSRVRDIETLLSNDTAPVIKIGVYGMGGIGKTTLAKTVYNRNYRCYKGSCFLENVREASQTKKGIVGLQQKLVNDVLKCKNIIINNVDQGIEIIRARICSTEILIVIDDLDNKMPLDYLVGPLAWGSTIIITTRSEDLLDAIKVEAKYKVKELSYVESHQLFRQHAFGGDNRIPDAFIELSKEILKYAGGLPLALMVCGSALLNESEEGWGYFIDKLRRVSIVDIEEILLISFRALVDPMLKDIFLDIACFFIGQEEEEVINMMKTCYTYVNYNIGILKKRCLLTINDGRIMMHDLIVYMGRKIACNSSCNVFEKHTRLWVSEDIQKMLKENKITREIEGMSEFNIYMKEMQFNKLGTLGTEATENGWKRTITSNSSGSFMPTTKCSNIKDLKQIFMATDTDMTTKIIQLQSLGTLNFKSESLKMIPLTIGHMTQLVSLSFQGWKNLKSLPDEICDLRALKTLSIGNCSNLEALPMNLGNMESLEVLNAEWLPICKLPHSIGRLSKLIKLNLSFCRNLKAFPDSICNLRSLKILNISWCIRLKVLPKELGKLESLVELKTEKLTSASKLLVVKHFI